ncbi:hypothetical protein HDU96_004529, partial [Phlyctochytrium bullatum]
MSAPVTPDDTVLTTETYETPLALEDFSDDSDDDLVIELSPPLESPKTGPTAPAPPRRSARFQRAQVRENSTPLSAEDVPRLTAQVAPPEPSLPEAPNPSVEALPNESPEPLPNLASMVPRPVNASTKELLDLAKAYANELPTLLSFAKYHIAKHLSTADERADNGRHDFQIGDLVWLSAPIGNDSSPKKFKFRWVGPVRVIGRSHDANRYCLVEVLHDGNLLPRLANAARLRPYVPRIPVDDPKAAATAARDDFTSEVRAWRELRVYQRRPALKLAPNINVELVRRADPDSLDEDPSDPEFIIEKLDRHHLNVDEK